MNKSNVKIYIYLIVITTVAIWAGLLFAFGIELSGSVEAIKKLPLVVTIEAIFWLIFTKWAWKLNFFQNWLIIEPIIEGTWKGKLITTWTDPSSKETPKAIPIVLSIKQTFNNVCCNIYTAESSSTSYIAKIHIDDNSGTKYFTYSYTNKPKANVEHKSVYHDGTANLTIIQSKGKLRMEGNYWTTRKTTGQIDVTFSKKELSSSFRK